MEQIRGLTTDIVSKVRGGMGTVVEGHFHDLEVPCPKCGSERFKESFKAYECANPECKLLIWKSMSGRELEREEVITLLMEKRVGPLEGFRSKLGRGFNAVVMLDTGEWKQKFDFPEKDGENGKPLDLSQAKDLGETAHGHVWETDAAFLCVKEGAKPIRMGKLICQRAIPADQALKIFRDGKTDLLPRFISKKGKPFAAYLKLVEGKVTFEFAPREKKAPAKKKTAAAASE
jgi:DNA topoisomerase-3